MNDPTRDGQVLIRRFLGAQEALERARSDVNSCECELHNSEAALAKWLMPSDMKPDEKVAVWMGDSLFQVEMVEEHAFPVEGGKPHVSYKPKVTVRTRGKEFHRLRVA